MKLKGLSETLTIENLQCNFFFFVVFSYFFEYNGFGREYRIGNFISHSIM